MSQAKVDKYKKYKANRKEIIAKEKKKKKLYSIITYVVIILVGAGIISGIVAVGVNNYKTYLASIPDYTATEQVFSDMLGILTETSEDTTDESGTSADESDSTADESETTAAETTTTETEAETSAQ